MEPAHGDQAAGVLSLPAEQQPAALAQLAGLGLDQGSPGLLRLAAELLQAGNLGSVSAYAQRISSEPPGEARNPGSPRAAAGFTSLRLTTDPNQRPQQDGKDLYQQAQMVFPPGGGLGGGGAGALGGGGTSPLPWLPQQEDRGVVLERAIRAIDKLFEPEPVPYEEAPRSNFDALPPPEPEEPRDFDTEEARQIAQELFGPSVTPAEVMPIFQLPGFTLDQFERGAVIEIFPDLSDRIEQATILENRKGNADTRNLNDWVRRFFVRIFIKVTGFKPEHHWGSRDDDGNEISELYLPNKITGGKKGSSWTDITFKLPGLNIRVHLNTADIKANGDLTEREKHGANKIIINMDEDEALIVLDKIRPGSNYDEEELERIFTDVIETLYPTRRQSIIIEKGWDKNYIRVPGKK